MQGKTYDFKKVVAFVPLVIVSSMFATSETKSVPPHTVELWSKLLKPYHNLCINETHIKPDALIHLLADFRLPDEKSMHCYWKCFHEHVKYVVDGKLNNDIMLKEIYSLTPEEMSDCSEKAYREEELCQRSYTLAQCVIQGAMV